MIVMTHIQTLGNRNQQKTRQQRAANNVFRKLEFWNWNLFVRQSQIRLLRTAGLSYMKLAEILTGSAWDHTILDVAHRTPPFNSPLEGGLRGVFVTTSRCRILFGGIIRVGTREGCRNWEGCGPPQQ